MILQISGIFILAFAIGYILGDIPARIESRKAASERKKKMAAMFPGKKTKPEKFN